MKHRQILLSTFAALSLSFAGIAFAQDSAAPAPAADAAAPAADASVPAAETPDAPPVDPIVEKGKYLATIGNCISCHTRPGGEPFAGGLAFQTPYTFLGELHSTNITQDKETGIGTWTEAEFIHAMRTGVDPAGTHLYPAFPYTAFSKVTEDDLKAIYAYIKTIPAVKYTPPGNALAFSQRWAMMFWNALFFKQDVFKPDTTQSDEWNRGAYLVEGLGHCSACHSPRNIFLAERTDLNLAGGINPDMVAPDKIRKWSAVNLTQASTGLGPWAVEQIAKYLKTGHSNRAGLFGPMNEVIVNSLQHLTPEDAKAMAVYLKSLPAKNEGVAMTLAEDQKKAGEKIYTDHCERCHLASGRGGFLKAPPVAGSAVVQAPDPASLINVILYGADVPKEAPAPFGAWESMGAFADKLKDDDVVLLVNFLRTSFDNKGSLVKAGDVARQR